MTAFDVVAIIVTATAVLGYINQRTLGLPVTIGVMLGGLLVSLVLVLLHQFGIATTEWAEALLSRLALNEVLFGGMLSFLLFAGALQLDLEELSQRRWSILILATAGTIASTLMVGFAIHVALRLFGIDLPLPFALVFGALISPTDPVAVLAILKDTNAPPSLSVMVTGESLFNDGVGVVLFAMLGAIAMSGADFSVGQGALLFLREAGGGTMFGALLGLVAYFMLSRVDHYTVEILITLAVVTGGYALAQRLHVSGPLAMVVAGLFIGNQGRAFAMSEETRKHLDIFWEVVDQILNAVLFVLIGVEVILLEFKTTYILAGIAAIAITLAARFISVGIPLSAMRPRASRKRYTVRVMTWGGLRGGIAVALALSLPTSPYRDLLLVLTYCVVIFSVVVQGLTVETLVRTAMGRND